MTWYVHIGAALLDPSATVRYIGRYTKGQRGQGIKGQRDGCRRREAGTQVHSLYPLAPGILYPFLVRYAGLFAPRWKARYLAAAHAALARENKAATKSAAESEPAKASLLPWRQRRLVNGAADPLLCPCCHVEMQLIEVAFGSHGMIAKYFEKAQRAIAPFHPVWQPVPR